MVNQKILINSIFISTIIMIVFLLGTDQGFSWKIGWSLLTIFSFSQIIYYIYSTIKKKIVTHLLLFNIGIFIFIIVDPFLAVLDGRDFPSVLYSIDDNYLSNKAGLIITMYILTFFFGALFYESILNKKHLLKIDFRKTYVNKRLIFISLSLSLIPFFYYGTGDIVTNLLNNILARSSGYVAFSSGGLGNQNPIIVLLIQLLPTTILILGILFIENKGYKKIFVIPPILALLFLYISLGGRGGFVFLLLSVLFYYYYQPKKKKVVVFNVMIVFFLLLEVLSYQINTREINSNRERSPIEGANLNKEIAFISQNYGETVPFTNSNNIIESLVKPLPELLILFITNPIPRLVWPNKPYDKSFGDYNYLRLGNTGYETGSNITPTIPGRFYLKYGFLGVFQIGLLLGFIWSFVNRQIYLNYYNSGFLIMIPISVSITLFVCTRDLSPGKFYPVLFLYLFYRINLQLKN